MNVLKFASIVISMSSRVRNFTIKRRRIFHAQPNRLQMAYMSPWYNGVPTNNMDWIFCVYHTQLTYTEIIVSHFESISLCARNRKHAPTVRSSPFAYAAHVDGEHSLTHGTSSAPRHPEGKVHFCYTSDVDSVLR